MLRQRRCAGQRACSAALAEADGGIDNDVSSASIEGTWSTIDKKVSVRTGPLADNAGLPGTYMAWLSDNTGSPSTRFTQSTTPYVLVDGTVIANNWADLTDSNLATQIDLTETGAAPPAAFTGICGISQTAWSNTRPNGTILSNSLHCGNWTGTGSSAWGRWVNTDQTWTQWCSGGACTGAWLSNLYCFQQ